MRWFLGVLLVAWAGALAACVCDPGIGIEIVNNTSSTLCWYELDDRVGDADYCGKIRPHSQGKYVVICLSHYEASVILTVGVAGQVIYNRTATCGEWKDSGAKIVIDQVEGKFVVTSSLPEATPTPAP